MTVRPSLDKVFNNVLCSKYDWVFSVYSVSQIVLILV